METDYTKSKTTFGGRKVNGLFRDKKFIRGYVAASADEWIAQTWFADNGAHIVWNDTELALQPEEATFHL